MHVGPQSIVKYASLFSGPLLSLSHPSPQMAPYLPAIHHKGMFAIFESRRKEYLSTLSSIQLASGTAASRPCSQAG
eukprot:1139265-Pelagomonas_calceolata.AAC.6